jgi:hypothetical protein
MLLVFCVFFFGGTTHLGNKNKGREADTIEKQKQQKIGIEQGRKRNA